VAAKLNPFCNLFLAEVYMDMMSSISGEHEIAGFLEDCDYHLCKIIGYISAENTSYDDGEASQNFGRELQFKGTGTNNCLWSFWVRFYWASGRLHYLQGTCSKGREDFHKCLDVLESRENSEIGSNTVVLPHCRTDNKISAEIVRHKIHEVQIQDMLSHQAATMLEEGRYSDLIELLAPNLFVDHANKESTITMPSKKRATDFSTELKALEMLIIACEKSEPKNFNMALQCFIRRLQIHFSTAGIMSLKGAKGSLLQSVKLHPLEGMKEDLFKVIAKEVKHITRFLADFDHRFPDKSILVISIFN
jgi:calcineurin-binding protein cabin-1